MARMADNRSQPDKRRAAGFGLTRVILRLYRLPVMHRNDLSSLASRAFS